MFPYIGPTIETADEIETKQRLIDENFIDLQTRFDKVNDVVSEQKKKKKIEEIIESVVDDTNPFSALDEFWWEYDTFSKKDWVETVDASKKILEDIRPVDHRTIEEIMEGQFIPIDDRAQQELKDDDCHSIESEVEDNKVTIEDDFDIVNFNKQNKK